MTPARLLLRLRGLAIQPWMPLAVAGLGVAATLWSWRSLDERDRRERLQSLEREAASVSSSIERQVRTRLLSPVRLAGRLSEQTSPGRPDWASSADLLFDDFSWYEEIDWIEPSSGPGWSASPSGVGPRQRREATFEIERLRLLDQARSSRRTAVSPVLDPGSGSGVMLVCAPALRGRRLAGFTLGVLRVEALLGEILNPHLWPGLRVAVFEDARAIHRTAGGPEPGPGQPVVERDIAFPGTSWHVQVWPAGLPANAPGQAAMAMLAAGLLMTFLLSLAVHLARKARLHAATIEEVNEGLRAEIVERRRVEDALRQSEERFRLLVEGVKDYAIFMLDPEGKVVSWNKGARRINGYFPAEIIGLHIARFYTPEDVQSGLPELELDVARSEGRVEAQGWRARKDGSRFWANSVITALRDETGRLRGFSTITRDITDRKRAEEHLQRVHAALEDLVEARTAELQRSNEELRQFAYVASHDLQEPLRMVANFTQLLARRYGGRLDRDADDFIHYVVDGVGRMQALIEGLLTYSRVQTRGGEFEPVDTGALCDQAVANLRFAIEESGAAVGHGEMPTVIGDPTQIAQLLQNLIGNALKFRAERPPQVRIGAERKGGTWVFSVRDNGIGIEPRFKERIFAIFQRLHTREEYPGNGIGLAICKKIVERHGGRIWLESRPGEGSTFFFAIPVARAAAYAAPLSAQPPSPFVRDEAARRDSTALRVETDPALLVGTVPEP